MEILSDHGLRQDGRKPNELRRLRCRVGVYSQADGSAYLEQGLTRVLCAVYGPHEPSGRNRARSQLDRCLINCQYSMATFSTGERKYRPRGDRKSQEATNLLQKTFTAAILTSNYPRSQIDIFCEVLQSDGGNLAACINAATLALVDAGVPMKDYVCAVGCSAKDETPIADISYAEESGAGPVLTLAILPRSEEIVLLELTSRLHQDCLDPLVDAGIKACKDVAALLDLAVKGHVSDVTNDLAWDVKRA